MAETDPTSTGTTEGATGTTAPAVDGSATTSAGGSEGVETIEQLRARLQDEQRKNAQLLAEKTRVEQMRQEVERERSASAPPTAYVDPYAAQMGSLQAIVARYGPDSYEGQMAIIQANTLEAARRSQMVAEFTVQVERDLLKIPAGDRDAVKSRLLAGEFDSVSQAHEAVRGKRSGQEVEALQRKVEELEKRLNGGSPRTADVATGIRTQVDAATHKKNMSREEYIRIMDAGGPRAEALMRQVDSEEVTLDG